MDARAQWLTSEKLTAVINSFGSFKAPGNDGLRPIVLKHLSVSSFLKLLEIYKACYLLGKVPKTWLLSRIVFLPKPLKPSYNTPKAYRPVALMPFVLKALEKLFLWSFNDSILKSVPIHGDQHGFRHGHICESALTSFIQPVEAALNKGKYCLLYTSPSPRDS